MSQFVVKKLCQCPTVWYAHSNIDVFFIIENEDSTRGALQIDKTCFLETVSMIRLNAYRLPVL